MKENIRLVLTDIDGTLLTSDKKTTERTRNAVARLRSHGILFGIATGRTPYAVRKLVYDWGIAESTDLIMGFNGGACYDMHTQEMTSSFPLKGEYVAEIMRDYGDLDINAGIFDRESMHAFRDDRYAHLLADGNKLPLVVDGLEPYHTGTVNKLLMMADPEKIDRAIERYETLRPSHYKAARSAAHLYEFINPDLSKSKGIESICRNLGIGMENVLTFGDEMNDYEMIRDCTGVAMGNGAAKVKEAAKYITASNDEDGVAVFLEEYIF